MSRNLFSQHFLTKLLIGSFIPLVLRLIHSKSSNFAMQSLTVMVFALLALFQILHSMIFQKISFSMLLHYASSAQTMDLLNSSQLWDTYFAKLVINHKEALNSSSSGVLEKKATGMLLTTSTMRSANIKSSKSGRKMEMKPQKTLNHQQQPVHSLKLLLIKVTMLPNTNMPSILCKMLIMKRKDKLHSTT